MDLDKYRNKKLKIFIDGKEVAHSTPIRLPSPTVIYVPSSNIGTIQFYLN